MLVSIAVLTRVISNSVGNLYQKKASEINSSVVVNMLSYFFMSIVCIIPTFMVDWTVFGVEFWINVIIAGVLCFLATLSLIEALRIGELSVLAPINSYKSVIGLISAFVLLGELPCFREIICVLFIIIGSLFVLSDSREKFSFKVFLRRDIRLRFFALLCSGVEASFLKKIIMMSDFKIAFILWCYSGFLCSFIVYIFMSEKSKTSVSKQNIINCFIIGVSLMLMQLTTNYVFSGMPVATALALFQLSSLVSLFFGYKVYKESNIFRKLVGTLIMISASVVILLG